MDVNVWDYLPEYETEKAELWDAVRQVLESGRLILGPSVERFEREFAAYCGVRWGVGVDNGTNALWLALLALGVRPGDEVATVSYTAVPTVSAIVTIGARPRFVDVDPDTALMDVGRLGETISERTKCIVAVHLYGQCVDMEAVWAAARRVGATVVEDCAQAHGARRHGRRAGSFGAAAAFSFYPTKILGGYGDGGMVVTDDEAVAERVRRKRMYGMEGPYYARQHGYNCRLDELHAEILRRKLRRLDDYVARRREIARRYEAWLADVPLQLPRTAAGNEHAYYLYVVRHPRRDEIIRRMARRGVRLNASYRWPVHVMEAYQWLGYKPGSLPVSERLAREVFSLPMYPSLTEQQQEHVCRCLREVLAELT